MSSWRNPKMQLKERKVRLQEDPTKPAQALEP